MQALGNGPAANLGAELEAANALLQLLKKEQAYLVEADVDGMAALTEEKNRLVMRMSELALQRHRSLGLSGFAGGEDGMRDWLKTSAANADTHRTWNELLQVAAQSKDLNRINGLLIGQHMARNQGALTILTGGRQGDGMYGPNGQTAARVQNRGFVVG
jgi:flagella synthesis protein FlgN